VTTTVTPSADLSIIKTDAPDPVWLGGIISTTLVVGNNGPSVAADVTLTDGVPVNDLQSIRTSRLEVRDTLGRRHRQYHLHEFKPGRRAPQPPLSSR
jgi:uncharacterized repeat protein (TIGR01451 family)